MLTEKSTGEEKHDEETTALETLILKMDDFIYKAFDVRFEEVKQSLIITPEKEKIYVDPCMKPVLTHLWSMGIETCFSCSGHSPRWDAYIVLKKSKSFLEYTEKSVWHIETHKKLVTPGDHFVIYSHPKGTPEARSRKNRDLFLKWLLSYSTEQKGKKHRPADPPESLGVKL
jgi:hypothetical protein